MNHFIHEVIVTTLHDDGATHIAPMGIWQQDGLTVLAPFKPSATLNNLQRHGTAVINYTDDVRVFAGCLTGRRDWPTRPAERIDGRVLQSALSHRELVLEHWQDDPLRPQCFCRTVHEASHAPFTGFNRAQSAVVEAAILVSRLGRIPVEKIIGEREYLTIAIDKTAGPREREAWGWLMKKIDAFLEKQLM